MGSLLEGRVAVVTGAGHGIGRGHAMELAKQGAKVVVNDLGGSVNGEGSGTAADDTVALIEKVGGTAVANYGDVSDHEQARAIVQQGVDAFGKLDIVVNNAGIVRDAAIWNMPEADFDAVMKVHVKGTWSMCHHAAVYWRERSKAGEASVNGRIINTTSGAGLGGNFGQTNYAAAKAAIVGMTQTLALELYRIGVTANAVGPSGLTRITATMPGMGESFEPDEVPEDEFRPMDPANSSPLVAWLASDEAARVTGHVIRSIHDRIVLMQGWKELTAVSSGNKRWDPNALGQVMATDIFGTRAAGMRF
jgi:NAD(P)-dependent dehydrogenase (short-subunit alcohol dehydrogenase family)